MFKKLLLFVSLLLCLVAPVMAQNVTVVGRGCPDSTGKVAQILSHYNPTNLNRLILELDGGHNMDPMFLIFNTYPPYVRWGVTSPLDLGFIGAGGCILYFDPFIWFYTPIGQTGQWGVLSLEYDLTALNVIRPFSFMVQGWIMDTTVPGGIRVSDAVVITF